jgi:outer membrane protein assembly factor BamB
MRISFSILFLLISVSLFSQDLVEFRGVGRTGHYNETGLLKKWPESGPEVFLTIEGVGKGFSQPIFADNKIFITGIKKDTTDILSAYNLQGELLWETPYGRSWTASYIDSRSTPTFEKGKLYVCSGTGQVSSVDASTGKILWQVNASKKYNGEIYKHGDAECPLVIENAVLYTTGGEQNAVVALSKKDGSLVWKSKSMGRAKAYASPVLINHNGQDIILAQTSKDLIAIRPEDGEILWSYNLLQYHLISTGIGAQTNPALYHNGEIFETSGYEHPGILLSLSEDGKSVTLKWRNDVIDTHIGGVVLVDGNIYGSTWTNNSRGKWASVNWETGKTNWETEWENKGSIIYADGMLYLFEEKRGNVALVEPSSEKMKIVSTFRVSKGAGPAWAHPAIYDRKLFIRRGDVLMVYNIKDN